MNFFGIESWDELIKRITCDLECAGCPFKEDCYKGPSNCNTKVDEHLMKLLKTRRSAGPVGLYLSCIIALRALRDMTVVTSQEQKEEREGAKPFSTQYRFFKL